MVVAVGSRIKHNFQHCQVQHFDLILLIERNQQDDNKNRLCQWCYEAIHEPEPANYTNVKQCLSLGSPHSLNCKISNESRSIIMGYIPLRLVHDRPAPKLEPQDHQRHLLLHCGVELSTHLYNMIVHETGQNQTHNHHNGGGNLIVASYIGLPEHHEIPEGRDQNGV